MPGTFDAGRGCPFLCSFCTIINVQGRKSRYRSPDDVEHLLRTNLAHGIRHYFITDDNFARNRNWEAIFDRIAAVREELGVKFNFTIQVDTMCHTLPGFVDKARRAGVSRVFLGLENIRPENLGAARKKQNKIENYREMLLAWQKKRVTTYCGYILGFPDDTPEQILEDIATIQRELPLDILEFFCLTPLPGSVDHQRLAAAGAPLDPDMNIYDLEHVCTTHPRMTKEQWQGIYRQAWDAYYSLEHLERLMRRATAVGPQSQADHGDRPGVLRLLQVRGGPPAPGRLHPPQGPHRAPPGVRGGEPPGLLPAPCLGDRRHLRAHARLCPAGLAPLPARQAGAERGAATPYMDEAMRPLVEAAPAALAAVGPAADLGAGLDLKAAAPSSAAKQAPTRFRADLS